MTPQDLRLSVAGVFTVTSKRARFNPSNSPPPGCVAQATQQANAIPKGQLVERLECLNDSSQSYALYLPSNYTPDRKWPVLYAFDPGARGKTPVERFKEAAEKYGWIVAGSNNSRNGPWRRSADAWSAMTKDTQQRFSIDDTLVYATGMSGGARMALQIAELCQDCLAGVIASGAGFPAGLVPSPQMHFLFFGTTGTDDFNFSELRSLDAPLTKQALFIG
jgi:poly(3-hydroxybutyrate) depolymerase